MSIPRNYDPHGSTPPRPRITIQRAEPQPDEPGTFTPLGSYEPPMSAICNEGVCMLHSSTPVKKKKHPVAACEGRCRLIAFKPDPELPKPPTFSKGK